MEKLKMSTNNNVDDNIEFIASRFPDAITESYDKNGELVKCIDFEALKQNLSKDLLIDNKNRYVLSWADKGKSKHLVNTSTNATLRPLKDKSVNFDTTENLYIEGDNLEVLKIIRETYLNKIDMIYIDPPYNTGNDFVYNDNFHTDVDDYLKDSGQYDEQGNNLFMNLESNGRFHTDWLNLMYPRLRVAKDLLSDDGVIFISINDNEKANLKKICDEIFYAPNFICEFIWEKTQHFGRQTLNCYSNCDYILVYAKNRFIDGKKKNLLVEKIKTELTDAPLYNASNNAKVLEFPVGSVKFNLADGIYTESISDDYILLEPVIVLNGKNKNILKLKFKSRWSNSTVQEEFAKGTTYWVKTENFAIRAIYGDDKTSIEAPKQLIFTNQKNPSLTKSRFNRRVDTSENATDELKKIMGKEVFSYPKPVSLIHYLCSLLYDEKKHDFNKDCIIMDFFSGSGTTAQAVSELNLLDGGHRKFIMVQLPENLDDNLKKCTDNKSKQIILNAIDLCDNLDQEHYLTNVAEERLRRSLKSIEEEAEQKGLNIDTGFRVLKLDSSNMNDVFYNPKDIMQNLLESTVDNVKSDRTALDLLIQGMLELGISLSSKIEEKIILNKKCYIVNENDIIACFDDDLSELLIKELASMRPLYAIFKDSSFSSDSLNINCEQIFKTISQNTIVKVL